ncbi:hypothetical protein ACFQGT_17515 [Natrialbaceae archaeon GCM10025810]|uniref:hypothetical protein n=1 Tax=Halovalidus salilacus TaxID=3075124 RepID=UPI00361A5DAF
MSTAHTQQTVAVFDPTVLAADAEQILLETDEEMIQATADGYVYYPYRVFGFHLRAKALIDEFEERVYCGIDLCNDKEMFIDQQPTLTERTVTEDALVPPAPEIEDPKQTARHYILELARKELRVGSPPELTVIEDQRVYRPFHLVECQTASGTFLTYIVDGVRGDFHRVYID